MLLQVSKLPPISLNLPRMLQEALASLSRWTRSARPFYASLGGAERSFMAQCFRAMDSLTDGVDAMNTSGAVLYVFRLICRLSEAMVENCTPVDLALQEYIGAGGVEAATDALLRSFEVIPKARLAAPYHLPRMKCSSATRHCTGQRHCATHPSELSLALTTMCS